MEQSDGAGKLNTNDDLLTFIQHNCLAPVQGLWLKHKKYVHNIRTENFQFQLRLETTCFSAALWELTNQFVLA